MAPLDPVLPAPDFTATDLDGNQVTLSSFKGHVVALFCGSERYAGRLHDLPESKQGKLVVLVATPHNPKSVKTPSPSHAVAGYSTPPDDPNPAQALQNDGYAFRVLFDPQDSIRKTLGLYSAPAVLIDAAGAIIWQKRIERRLEKEDSGLFLATEQVLANHFKFCSTFPGSVTEGKTNSEQVLYDFEDGFQDWKTTGDCWEKSPATDTLYPGLVKGYAGRSFLSTFGSKGFRATGLAISPEFAISKPFLHCLVGGGDLPDRCAVALVCDGCTVKRAGGKNSAELEPVCWDVHGLMGKKVHLEVYDSGAVEPRDFIMLDQVVASDSAAIPASYAKRFDPDDPKSSAEAADGLPAIYKAMQAGEFHEAPVPGPTYRLERTNNVRWPDNEQADWLELTYIPPPTHHGETMRSFSMIVEAGGKSYPSRPFMTGRALRPEEYVCYIPAGEVPDRRGIVKIKCEMTANRLHILKGGAPDPPRLSASLREILTSPHQYPFTDPLITQFITRNELWRWPGETDAAYLLRAYRYFQRYYIYGITWAGWPSYHRELGAFETLAADCGLAHEMVLLLRANGIPAHYEQGFWVGDNGIEVGPHVKALVFIQKVGWLWFGVHPEVNSRCDPFDIGSRSNDNFIGEWLNDLPAPHQIPDPTGANKVLHGQIDGGDWWHSWVVSKVPQPPAGYLLDPHMARVADSRKNTFIWQPQCNDDSDDDHYVFGGWAPAADHLDYMAYGMASVRGVMKMGIVSLAHPDGNSRQVEWPITAKAGQKLRFTCCLTDRALKEIRLGVKIQVELSGGGQISEVLTDELKPGDSKVIDVTKTLTDTETNLIMQLDNCGNEYWTVLYCDASLE